jgi:hypothetical protein
MKGACPDALLVQLSTDQVYDGHHAVYTEGDEAKPVNAYGRQKLDFEREIVRSWPRHRILRSSLIYGPPPPRKCTKGASFLQFLEKSLGEAKDSSKPVTLFEDEASQLPSLPPFPSSHTLLAAPPHRFHNLLPPSLDLQNMPREYTRQFSILNTLAPPAVSVPNPRGRRRIHRHITAVRSPRRGHLFRRCCFSRPPDQYGGSRLSESSSDGRNRVQVRFEPHPSRKSIFFASQLFSAIPLLAALVRFF